VTEEADIDDWRKGDDITIRLVRAIAGACQAEPSLNAWYNAQAAERRLIKRIDLGIAIDTEGGLIVPVLRNVGERTPETCAPASIACEPTLQRARSRRRSCGARQSRFRISV
jgi:hypothetical protein